MTDHNPFLLPSFPADQNEAGHGVLPVLSLPAVSVPAVASPNLTVSRRVRSGAAIDRLNRSALWFATTGRWMNRSFDPVGSEAIRESYGTAPATGGEDDGA